MKAVITLSLVVCLAAFALASPYELDEVQKAKVKTYFDECVKQENLTEEEADKVHKKDYANPSKNLKCYATCFFEKTGTLKNNEIQEDVVVAKLTGLIGEEKTKIVLERCKNLKDDDRCEKGFLIFECLEKAKKDLKA